MMVWLGILVIVVSAVLSLRSTGSSSSWASVAVLLGVLMILAGSCSVGPLTGL